MDELADKKAKGVYAAIQLLDYAELTDSQRDQEKVAVIEQALLAERRLAMELCAEIADEPGFHCEECVGGSVSSAIVKALRAAAEKEVGHG